MGIFLRIWGVVLGYGIPFGMTYAYITDIDPKTKSVYLALIAVYAVISSFLIILDDSQKWSAIIILSVGLIDSYLIYQYRQPLTSLAMLLPFLVHLAATFTDSFGPNEQPA